MKVDLYSPGHTALGATGAAGRAAAGPRTTPTLAGFDPHPLQLSEAAAFVQDTRIAGGTIPLVRHDVVADVRAALDDGSFEQGIDWEAAIDGLLADL